MTQPTTGISFVEAVVFCSPDGTVWTEVSGHGASVAAAGGERATGEQNTFGAALPIVKAGSRASSDVTVRFVYTPTDAEPFAIARAAHESASGAFWAQYRPATADKWFKTGAGVITNLVYPQGEAGTGEVIMSEFVIKCASISEAAAST